MRIITFLGIFAIVTVSEFAVIYVSSLYSDSNEELMFIPAILINIVEITVLIAKFVLHLI